MAEVKCLTYKKAKEKGKVLAENDYIQRLTQPT